MRTPTGGGTCLVEKLRLRKFQSAGDDIDMLATKRKNTRRAHRVSCFVPVLCSTGRRTEKAMVLDVSTIGMRVRLAGRFKAGSVLKLHYPPFSSDEPMEAVAATVVWARQGEVG